MGNDIGDTGFVDAVAAREKSALNVEVAYAQVIRCQYPRGVHVRPYVVWELTINVLAKQLFHHVGLAAPSDAFESQKAVLILFDPWNERSTKLRKQGEEFS